MIDWKTITTEIIGVYKIRSAASMCGCQMHTLARLAKGTTIEPKYSLGVNILEVHSRLGQPPQEIREPNPVYIPQVAA